MTDTQPEPIGFGLAEFAFLLNGFEGPSQQRSVAAFKASEFVSDDTLSQVGASALAARGFIAPAEEGISVEGAASAVAQTLGTGTRWITIEFAAGSEEAFQLVLVDSPESHLLFQPGILRTWFAVPLPEDLSSAQTAVSILHQHAEEEPAVQATVSVITLERESSYVLTHQDGLWSAAGVTDSGTEAIAEGLNPPAIADLLEAAGA